MKLRLSNNSDVQAAATVAGLQNWRSLAEVIAEYAVMCPSDDDFTITINKQLLDGCSSYKSNPSVLALQILGKLQKEFQDCAGYQTPSKMNQITLVLHRQPKADGQRRSNPRPSIKSLIKEFLNLNHDTSMVIEIPVSLIPRFTFSHPEQLAYVIKRETSTPIKIERNEKVWIISRK